jgi:hypothetical protein
MFYFEISIALNVLKENIAEIEKYSSILGFYYKRVRENVCVSWQVSSCDEFVNNNTNEPWAATDKAVSRHQ